MAKKKKRESTDKKNNKQSSRNCNSKQNSNSKNSNSKQKSNDNIKFSDFSYAELIVLAATLSYSLAEELDEDDIAIFLVFLGLLLADMQTLLTQRSIKAKRQAPTTEDLELETEI
ncbi:hypothetical protein [Terrisporobacter glycolicus]|uniref:Uncharacterized protein n=1 Tax=Terrisporobacter glycolicus ATCC 14880 = DSM 1288 TaxID=1121315 RepID=A0ABZ2ETX0_9FIRM|nr:hypothetical protein [Terrisporobacter glycolicus]